MVEKREEPVVILGGERIKLMVMALRALKRTSQPDRARGIHTVEQCQPALLLLVDAALGVEHRIAVKARGDLLIAGSIWKEISGKLFDRELVVRQVLIKRLDDPIAVWPDRPHAVLFVAIRIS